MFATTLALLSFNSKAQTKKQIDTIYLRAFEEDINTKFYSAYQNQYNINFFFKVKWVLHNAKRDVISFSYHSPKKEGINEWYIFTKDEREFLPYKNYYTLEQFTIRLKNPEFFQLIFLNKVQIVMLYGAKCSTKVELYPVKLSTDISSEG